MTFPSWAEPDFFTLEQICQRWSDWNCTVPDLLQLCKSGKIEIGVNLSRKMMINNSLVSGYFALSPHDIKLDQNDIRAETSMVYESQDKEINKGEQNTVLYSLAHKLLLGSRDLVITKKERDRFESKNEQAKTTDDSPVDRAEPPMNSREKNGMLSVIEALCLMSNLDTASPFKVAGIIKKEAELAGIKTPSEQTISSYLKAMNDRSTN